MNEPVSVRLQAMPLHEEIESRQSKRQSRLKRGPRAMQHLLQMTYPRQHRQHGLDQHAGIPPATLTQLEIGWVALFGMEAAIAQDDHLPFKSFNQGMESTIRRIGSRAIPGHHQTHVIEQQAELTADNPAMVGFAFAPNLQGTAPFAHGMEQFDPIAVHYAQDRGGGQKCVRPRLVGGKEAKETRAFGHGGKQAAPVAAHPAIECPISHTLEGKEQAQGYDLTGPETGLGMFRHVLHALVYPVEQLADKVFGSHAALLGLSWCGNPTAWDRRMADFKSLSN